RDFHVTGVQTCALPILGRLVAGRLAHRVRVEQGRQPRDPRDGRERDVPRQAHRPRGARPVPVVGAGQVGRGGGGGRPGAVVARQIGRASCRGRGGGEGG